MEQLEAVIVLTTWPAESDASAMAGSLVEERLAACVNLLPAMDSVYRWQGAVERAREQQVIIKTGRGVVDRLLARLKELHPYDMPEALVLAVSGGDEAYLQWVGDSVGPTREIPRP